MIMIVAIWLFSFSHTIHSQSAEKGIEKTQLPSLFESLGRDFSSLKQQLEASFKNINLDNEGQK
jgi:hypothetical protein